MSSTPRHSSRTRAASRRDSARVASHARATDDLEDSTADGIDLGSARASQTDETPEASGESGALDIDAAPAKLVRRPNQRAVRSARRAEIAAHRFSQQEARASTGLREPATISF